RCPYPQRHRNQHGQGRGNDGAVDEGQCTELLMDLVPVGAGKEAEPEGPDRFLRVPDQDRQQQESEQDDEGGGNLANGFENPVAKGGKPEQCPGRAEAGLRLRRRRGRSWHIRANGHCEKTLASKTYSAWIIAMFFSTRSISPLGSAE